MRSFEKKEYRELVLLTNHQNA